MYIWQVQWSRATGSWRRRALSLAGSRECSLFMLEKDAEGRGMDGLADACTAIGLLILIDWFERSADSLACVLSLSLLPYWGTFSCERREVAG